MTIRVTILFEFEQNKFISKQLIFHYPPYKFQKVQNTDITMNTLVIPISMQSYRTSLQSLRS